MGRERLGLDTQADCAPGERHTGCGFVKTNAKGELVNRCETIGNLGSSNVDSEECWLMSVKARALGLVYIDHQARV
jgi:hypothetical protein